MSDFQNAVRMAAEKTVIKMVSDGQWLQPNYEARFRVPVEWIAECWGLVDKDKLKAKVAALIENELAERMVATIAAELSTDMKQIMAVKERREMLRQIARANIDAIMNAAPKHNGE